jgi:choline dehydrogenase-like flavoprotein
VLTECVATEVRINDRGRAEWVVYYDRENRQHVLLADIVVIAGSATETARLLLNSTSRLFPNGAGNNNDWVGRNLQGHAYTGAVGLFEQEVYQEAGPGACIAVCNFNHGNPGLAGGGALCNEFIRLPYLFSQNGLMPGTPRWGKAHKDYMRRNYKRNLGFQGPVQEIPVFDARISVDPAVVDHWGMPVGVLSGQRHPHDLEIADFLSRKAEEVVREAGAIRTWRRMPGRGVSGGQHQAGTCRMGDDPATSVTNRYGQVHQIDNLFIADGSLLPTNGGFNPVLTILAMGYWVGGYIRREWNGTRFRS